MAKKKPTKPMDDHTRAMLHREITEQVRTLIARAGHLRDIGWRMRRPDVQHPNFALNLSK